ncbi:hypothetical protein BDV38DRAFT_292355 [Aspergillus pseudotamarii]|uniref:Zn(2)-C6 fungal-type domain-containing protein n=1 Tax=Aspergillus pseudotamarii TaxID=132259 RepID=A0A5N6SWA1_ASPPS|nr:uncharacterized protein BDV38DRAFT_292355 [Aspergillus pseudotamarii]KAE8138167.1 hypothetical protein BDV38DRAFT_292355 [Aspergillus pseudotamarii]
MSNVGLLQLLPAVQGSSYGNPKCARCERSGIECVRRAPRNFRHTISDASLAGYRTLQYIDETPKFNETSPTEASFQSPKALDSSAHAQSLSPFNSEESPSTPFGAFSSRLLDTPHLPWPQIGPKEACLLRYFVEYLARWFDLCDPERHFVKAIPQIARGSEPLRNAILAVSARHFSTLPKEKQGRITEEYGLQQDLAINEETVLYYHNKCITDLRSLASEPEALMDEILLATVVILRFYEELDSPFIDLPTETAIQGLNVFVEAQAKLALSTPGLRQAVFWVGFRQEFHVAFSQQRPIRLPLSITTPYLTWAPAPDHIWTNRLLIICAHALQYCYDDHPAPLDRYYELIDLHNRWLKSRPPSFSPVYYEEPNHEMDDQLFPKIWYLDDCHIVASQSMGLLNILLTAYSPHIPRVGPLCRESMDVMNAKLRAIVFEICGIAVSNRQSPPAFTTLCIAVNICGDRFTDLREQKALMEVLVGTTRETSYWPTTESQKRLKEIWGWDD